MSTRLTEVAEQALAAINAARSHLADDANDFVSGVTQTFRRKDGGGVARRRRRSSHGGMYIHYKFLNGRGFI